MTAFYRASGGLSRLRAPILWAGELANFDIPKDLDKKDDRRVRDHGVYAARAEAGVAHCSNSSRNSLGSLGGTSDRRFVSWSSGSVCRRRGALGLDGPVVAKHADFQTSMRRLMTEHRHADGSPAGDDKLSNRIDVARAGMEAACRPLLDEPPWLKKLSSLLGRG